MSTLLLEFTVHAAHGRITGPALAEPALCARALLQVSLAIRRFAATELPVGWRVPVPHPTPMGYARLPLPVCLERLTRFIGDTPALGAVPDGPLGLAERIEGRVAFRFLPAFAQLSPQARAQALLDWRFALFERAY